MHGGKAPQVAAAREARILAAEAARSAPVTAADSADVLTSAMNDAHAILQRLKENIAAGTVTTADIDAIGQWIDRAARVGKVVNDAGLEERRVRIAEAEAQQLVAVIQQVLTVMLQGSLDVLRDLGPDADVTDAMDAIEGAWPRLIGEHVPRILRAVDAESKVVTA